MRHVLGRDVNLGPILHPCHFHGHRPYSQMGLKGVVFLPTNLLFHPLKIILQLILPPCKRSPLEELVLQIATSLALVFCTYIGLGVDVGKRESYRNVHHCPVRETLVAYDCEFHATDVHPIIHAEWVIDLSQHKFDSRHGGASRLLGEHR